MAHFLKWWVGTKEGTYSTTTTTSCRKVSMTVYFSFLFQWENIFQNNARYYFTDSLKNSSL